MSSIFVIYAPNDESLFERLKTQAKTARLSVDFEGARVKQPWVAGWKGQCRTKISKSDCVIVLISKNTAQGGIEWEVQCAREFDQSMLGIHVDKARGGAVPDLLRDVNVIEWNWPDIEKFIRSATGSSAFA